MRGVNNMDQQKSVGMLSKSFLYRQRLGYGLGDFACNLIWQVISLYLLYFYTDVVHLGAKSIAVMFMICRVSDAITDVLVGFAIDKTKTRWGKSRPWFLFGAVPFAVAAFLAFSVPDISPDGKLLYAYATYIFLSFMYTVVNIPLASILPACLISSGALPIATPNPTLSNISKSLKLSPKATHSSIFT